MLPSRGWETIAAGFVLCPANPAAVSEDDEEEEEKEEQSWLRVSGARALEGLEESAYPNHALCGLLRRIRFCTSRRFCRKQALKLPRRHRVSVSHSRFSSTYGMLRGRRQQLRDLEVEGEKALTSKG